MLSTAARANLTIVLVGARNPSNIGAAARAMQDFGFSDLRIVNDFAAPFEAAQLEAQQPDTLQPDNPAAVAAGNVMRNARRYNTLAPAIADCTLIVATTAIGERDATAESAAAQATDRNLALHVGRDAVGDTGTGSTQEMTAGRLAGARFG